MKYAALLVFVVGARIASAGVVQVPEGGKPIPVTTKGVVCGQLTGGWSVDPADRRLVVPPSVGAPDLVRSIEAKIADTAAGCATTRQSVTLVALGAWPDVDGAGVTLYPDDGRIEIKGQRLKGMRVGWTVPGDDKHPARADADACLDPVPGKACAIPIPTSLPVDAPLSWLPAYGRFGDDVVTYDAQGARLAGDGVRLKPARVVLSKPLVQTTGVDVTNGPARVMLSHPEVVSSVDCSPASCELAESGVSVRSAPGLVKAVTLRLRLAPRVFAARGEALDALVVVSVPLLACPMAVIDGTALRDIDDSTAVVKLDPQCSKDPQSLHWTAAGDQADVRRVVKTSDGVYVQLRVGRITSDKLTISASRLDDSTIVASASARTVQLPQPRVALELIGHGKIDFVPTNRPATITIAAAGLTGRLVPIAVAGAYRVSSEGGAAQIQAEDGAEGFVALRFGYRVPSLPAELAASDLVVVTEYTQRAVREAAVPAAIGANVYDERSPPLIELVCGDGRGGSHRVAPSQQYRIAYDARDSCRIIIHRERLSRSDGSQEITLEVEVVKVDGTPRAEAKLSEHMVLRPGAGERVIPIKGGLAEFDRVAIRVSHIIDEARYVVSTTAPAKPGLLSAQWSAIVDGSWLRLYATATIPAGLYRVNHPSGQLTLNFGVLSRLTTLNRQGKEGLFGLEIGVMGLGLVPQQGNVNFPVTLAIVSGLGFRVPLGQGAAIGIQAWVAREFRDGPIQVKDSVTGNYKDEPASAWSFVFGPTISFGNVGLNI